MLRGESAVLRGSRRDGNRQGLPGPGCPVGNRQNRFGKTKTEERHDHSHGQEDRCNLFSPVSFKSFCFRRSRSQECPIPHGTMRRAARPASFVVIILSSSRGDGKRRLCKNTVIRVYSASQMHPDAENGHRSALSESGAMAGKQTDFRD